MHPKVKDINKIGNYPALVKAGGGYIWDEVLEYRVWCRPENGAENIENGDNYFYVFGEYKEALAFSKGTNGAEEPIALILQKEYIDELETGIYNHVKEKRITEWPVEFLTRPKRNNNTISDFLSPNAPENRLEILRGIEK